MSDRLRVCVPGLLLAVALFFSGCSTAPEVQPTAMGRYVEESLTLPADPYYTLYMGQNGDGELLFISAVEIEDDKTELQVWRSADNGTRWVRDFPDWLELVEDSSVNALDFDKDGIPYFVLWADEEDTPRTLSTIRDGALVPLAVSTAQENGYTAEALHITDSGDAVTGYYYQLQLADSGSGKIKAEIESDVRLGDGFFFTAGDTLAVSDKDSMKLYSTETGELLQELPFFSDASRDSTEAFFSGGFSDQTAIAPSADLSAYYYCNSSGIYKMSADGELGERILDGGLNSLGMPTTTIVQLLPRQDSSFLVYCTNEDNKSTLLRYRYDAAVPTVPSRELKVYSLQDSATVRQAIGEFQRQNGDVKVVFDVGLTADSGVTGEDALRTLSTELLAGKGPDVLVLDGMPVDSYRSKGALLNLDTILADTAGLLPNITGIYRQESGLYAIPARFSVPMILGTGEVVSSVSSLAKLAEYIETQENAQIGYQPGEMLEGLYPALQNGWFREDGSLDDGALSRDLADIKRLIDPFQGDPQNRVFSSGGNLIGGACIWNENGIPLYLGRLESIGDLTGPYTAIQNRGDGFLSPFPSREKAVFLPRVLLGVNSTSSKTALAGQFIDCVLSDSIQASILGDGMPVNRAALAQNGIQPYDRENGGTTYGMSIDPFPEGEMITYMLKTRWPDEAFLVEIMDLLETVDTPVLINGVVHSLILSEAEGYLTGDRPLEEAVGSIRQKLDLYLAE